MLKKYNFRHGDLCGIQINKLPEGLKKSTSKVLITGSHNNPHTYDNGKFYPKKENDFVFGYFVAKDTTLLHPDHGKKIKDKVLLEAKIKDGKYQLRSQIEDTNSGMKQVID